jgi:hypothetical protein
LKKEILRKVCGPIIEHVIWRSRNNQELRKGCQFLDNDADIKRRRIKLLENWN